MTPPMSPPPTLFASPTHSQASSGWPTSHLAQSIGGSSTGARSDVSSVGPSTRQSWGSLGPGAYPSPPSAQRLSNSQAAAVQPSHQSLAQHASPFLGGAYPHALLVESPASSNQPTSASAEAPSPLELSPRGETILGARSMSPVEQAIQEEDEQDPSRRQFVNKGKGRRTSTTSSSAAVERQDEKLHYYNRARHDSIDRLLVRSASSHSSTSLGAPRVASPAPSPPPQRALPPPPATLPTAIDRPLLPPQISAARSALLQPSDTPAPAPQPSPSHPPSDVAYHSDAPSDAESLMDPEDSAPASRRGTLQPEMHESVGSFATGFAESDSTYPEGDDLEEEEEIASAPQPLRTRDEIELAGWREAARQAVQAGAGRPVRSPTCSSAVGGEERARERLAFPMPPEQSTSTLPSSASPPSLFRQPFSHAATQPSGSAPAPTSLRPTFEDPMTSPAAHQQWQLPASSSMSRLGSSNSLGEQEMLRATAGQRQGSLASVNSNATMHIGQRDRTGSLGVQVCRLHPATSAEADLGACFAQSLPPVPMASSSPTVPDDPIWRDYRSKNLTLSISPPVDSGRWLPGQVFSFRLVLDPKVSRTSYEKLEVKLVGNSFVYGEPPDNHDFMVQRTSIFPSSSPSVREIGTAGTSFAWQMQLPREQTCDCSLQPHVLPPSYGHANFRVECESSCR